jgi:hypothetical protein
MERNVEVLQRGLALVLDAEARGKHNQENWITVSEHDGTSVQLDCNTSGCFAGHLVMDAGYRFLTYLVEDDFVTQVLVDDQGNTLMFDESFGDYPTIAEHARSMLGLTYDEADALFHFANTTEDLKFLVDRLCAGEPIKCLYDHRGVQRDLLEGDK